MLWRRQDTETGQIVKIYCRPLRKTLDVSSQFLALQLAMCRCRLQVGVISRLGELLSEAEDTGHRQVNAAECGRGEKSSTDPTGDLRWWLSHATCTGTAALTHRTAVTQEEHTGQTSLIVPDHSYPTSRCRSAQKPLGLSHGSVHSVFFPDQQILNAKIAFSDKLREGLCHPQLQRSGVLRVIEMQGSFRMTLGRSQG